MNLDFLKEFVTNQNKLNKTSSQEEIKKLSSMYSESILSKNYQDLKTKLDELNEYGGSAIYLSNYKIWKNILQKNGISQEIFFENNSSLIEWTDKYFALIQSYGGLEIFIALEKLKNSCILLHYRGDIILKSKKYGKLS